MLDQGGRTVHGYTPGWIVQQSDGNKIGLGRDDEKPALLGRPPVYHDFPVFRSGPACSETRAGVSKRQIAVVIADWIVLVRSFKPRAFMQGRF